MLDAAAGLAGGGDLALPERMADQLHGGRQPVLAEAEALSAGLRLDQPIAAEIAARLAPPRLDQPEPAVRRHLAQFIVLRAH